MVPWEQEVPPPPEDVDKGPEGRGQRAALGPEDPSVQPGSASRVLQYPQRPRFRFHHACATGLQPRLTAPLRTKVKAKIPLPVGKP